jgi:antirestriction protein ArdC
LNVHEIVTERIIRELESGTVPWRKPWSAASPKNLVSRKEYRGINRLLLTGSEYWITFKQALDLGGHVNSGERASIAVFWKTLDKRTKEEGEEEGDEKRRAGFVLRYYSVFRLDQCSIPADKLPAPGPVVDTLEAAEAIVAGYQDGPKITTSTDRAFYAPNTDIIGVPGIGQFLTAGGYYQTLFHELAHSTGSFKRLARFQAGEVSLFGSETYSREELIAELGASFLSAEAGGLEAVPLVNAAAYIAGWKSKLTADPMLIVKAASAAERAAKWIRRERS